MFHGFVMVSLLVISAPSVDVSSELELPVQVEVDGQPVDVQREGHSAPFVADFNGDGIRDLLVGEYHLGRVRFYQGASTSAAPKFGEFQWLKAGESLAAVPTDCCVGFTPQVIDLDRDGLVDLISGSYPGEIYFFRRQDDGTLATGKQLLDDHGKAINAGHAATAFAADWDNDGTLDLLLGNIKGEVHLARGSQTVLTFGNAERLTAAGKPIEAHGGDSAPVVADWDADGRLDLVFGSGHGSVHWCRNVGSQGKPKLEQAQLLVGESPLGWGSDDKRARHDWGLRVKPCVVDWNGDGRLDLLMGDRCGGFQAKPTQTAAEREEELHANEQLPVLRRNWSAAFGELRQLQAAPQDDEAARIAAVRDRLARLKDEIARAQEIQERYQPTRQAHGFVWVFLRKSNP